MNKIASLLLALFAATVVARAVEVFDETVDETYSLGAEPTIDISNVDGSIRIYAADVPEVHLHAVKHAYKAERLERINVDAKSDGTSLTVTTIFPAKPRGLSFADRSGTVDYTLIVPTAARIARCNLSAGELLIEGLQGGSIKAHVVNGWLAAHNCFVDQDVSIVNGRLDVAFDWWQATRPLTSKATSVNGTVRALIPPDAAVALSAETQNGHVANTFDDEEPGVARRSVTTFAGPGDTPPAEQMNLRSVNGNIRLDRSY